MEYFAGSVVTLITMYIVAKLINHPKNSVRKLPIKFSQSRQYELTADFLPAITKQPAITQASKHHQAQYTRIVFLGNVAYWIEDSRVYTANFEDGMVDYDNKMVVDMTAIDKVELDKMIFVVERLTEGLSNDSGNSGN